MTSRKLLASPASGSTRIPTMSVDRLEDLSSVPEGVLMTHQTVIGPPVRFGNDLDEDLRNMRWLRDATGRAARLSWTIEGRPLLSLVDLAHLAPPTSSTTVGDAHLVADWASRFRYAAFYYRVGPGFVTVKDIRRVEDARRMLISGADAAEFIALATGIEMTGTESEDSLTVLEQAGLIRRTTTSRLVLPYRLKGWPVPSLTV